MPNIKSAKKRLVQNERSRKVNSTYKTRVRSTRRKFLLAVEEKNVDLMKSTYADFCSALDKAAKKNVIKKNTAIRSKHRGAEKIRAATES
ncbi:MAG: 30S ribosomal protein S20 [Verrucomicrobia bacterium]|nr:30S ribosomal protein S20 [Verrucomicrobiota bacterium]MCH8514450.1 30S ribosomal protein S20 [Kiritimatiellia bacterium]